MKNTEAKNKIVVELNAKLPGRSYRPEKPTNCVFCYFWAGMRRGCGERNCYYLLPEKDAPKGKAGECDGCPYGKHSPCIGYCIARLEAEMQEKRRVKALG